MTLPQVWSDPARRQALATDPRPGLRDLGIAIPADVSVKAVCSKGAPSDKGHTLIQFVLDRGPVCSYFFMASPLYPSAQQAAYGETIGSAIDDAVFLRRLHADASAALRALDRGSS